MCVEQIEVSGLDSEREAHEVEQYLLGTGRVQRVLADPVEGTITVEYDETVHDHDTILDEIEYAGCVPKDRVSGMVERIKYRLA